MNVLYTLLLTIVTEVYAVLCHKEKCKDNGGTEFSVMFLKSIRDGEPLRLYLNTNAVQQVKVEITTPTWVSAQAVNLEVYVNSGNTTVVDLPEELELKGSVVDNKVVRVVATDNIFLQASNIKSSTGDAFIVYPVSSLGTEYLAPSTDENDFIIGVVALHDDTSVHVQLPIGSHVIMNGTTYLMEYTITLKWFEVLHLDIVSADYVLVKADKIVSVNSGHKFERVATISGTTGDHTEEQMLPIRYWSKEYIIAPSLPYTYAGFGENVKIYAYHNDTIVEMINSSTKIVLELTATGDFYKFFIKSGQAVIVKSDKEIGVFQSGVSSPISDYPSDAYLLQVTGIDQYVKSVVFPTILSNSNIIHNIIMLVSTKNAINNIHLNNELITSSWASVGNSDYAFTYVNITEPYNILQTSNEEAWFTAILTGVDYAVQYALAVGKHMDDSQENFSQNNSFSDTKISKFGKVLKDFVPSYPPSYTGPDSLFQCFRICKSFETCSYVVFNSEISIACRTYEQQAYCSKKHYESGSNVYCRYE